MVPLEGPHQKKTEGARAKSAPLATAVSAKRAVRSKSEKSRKPVIVAESVPAAQSAVLMLEEPNGEPLVSQGAPEGAIRLSAYFKWVAAGRPEGDGVSFWLEAEQGLLHG
jgi:hypothetical protein